jgi:excisionase family DNA binding protein
MNAKHDEILTMDELAAYLKISKSTLYKLAVEDKLPGQKIGKRWRFHKDAIDAWVTHGLENPPTKPGSGKEQA